MRTFTDRYMLIRADDQDDRTTFCGYLKRLAKNKGFRADHIPSNVLEAVFHKCYFVHSWILCPKHSSSQYGHLAIYMNPKHRSGSQYHIHIQKLFHGSDDCKILLEKNFCMDFIPICWKSGLAYERCEHLKIVDDLKMYFPEHVILYEVVLETLILMESFF